MYDRDPLPSRVASRFAAERGLPSATAKPERDPNPAAVPFLVKAAEKRGLLISFEGHLFTITAREPMTEKEVSKAFEAAWVTAAVEAREAGIEDSRFGLRFLPKLDFKGYHPREQGTGKYLHSKWTRLCRCGHPVGIHSAEKRAGSQPCLASDVGIDCDCERFRPTQKFISDEEYEKTYKV